jgi:hypothetical protein
MGLKSRGCEDGGRKMVVKMKEWEERASKTGLGRGV